MLTPRSIKATRCRANPSSLIQPQTHRRPFGVVRRRCRRPRLAWMAHARRFRPPRAAAHGWSPGSALRGTPAAMRRSATRCRQSDVRSCRCTNSSCLGCRCSMSMAKRRSTQRLPQVQAHCGCVRQEVRIDRGCELNPASAIKIPVEHLRREPLRKSRLTDPRPVPPSVNSLVVPCRCSTSINSCSRPTKLLSSAGTNRCHAICKCMRLCEIKADRHDDFS